METQPASETSSLLKSLEDGQSPKNEMPSVSNTAMSKFCSVEFVCRGNFFPYFSLSNFIFKFGTKIET